MRKVKLTILGLLCLGVFKITSQPQSAGNHKGGNMPITVEVKFQTNMVWNIDQIKAKTVQAIKARGWKPIDSGFCGINISVNTNQMCNVLFYEGHLDSAGRAKKIQQIKIGKNGEITEMMQSPDRN
jgi:hypothetical protein